jgi:hypothetical protein
VRALKAIQTVVPSRRPIEACFPRAVVRARGFFVPTRQSAQCIPANHDISGIGVRVAIYTQPLLCFAPVVAQLWDGKVAEDEMDGIEDKSIGMLAVAFAVLIF